MGDMTEEDAQENLIDCLLFGVRRGEAGGILTHCVQAG